MFLINQYNSHGETALYSIKDELLKIYQNKFNFVEEPEGKTGIKRWIRLLLGENPETAVKDKKEKDKEKEDKPK